MSDLPIPAEAIEAAAKALQALSVVAPWPTQAEAALRAAFDALGVEMYEREIRVGSMTLAKGIGEYEWRFVSRWFPVKP